MRSLFSTSILAACLVHNVASLVIERLTIAETLAKRQDSSQLCSSASNKPASTTYGKELYSCITSEPDGDKVSTNITNTVKSAAEPLDQKDTLATIGLVKSSLTGPPKIDYRSEVGDVAFSLHVCNTNAEQLFDTLKSGLDGLTELLPKTWSGKSVGQAVGFFTNSGQGTAGVATYVIGASEYKNYAGAYTCNADGPPTTSSN